MTSLLDAASEIPLSKLKSSYILFSIDCLSLDFLLVEIARQHDSMSCLSLYFSNLMNRIVKGFS